MTENTQPKCVHDLLENGVHQFSLVDSSMASAEAYMQELEKIYALRTPASPTLHILFDAGNGTLPISFTMQRGKELVAKYPNVGKVCIATLTDKMVEIRIVDSLMRVIRLPNTRLRFFGLSRREDALKWLLQDS
ncbi:MAG: hypothetical protein ABI700_12600 [Chloroflexota bacterium]